MSASPLAVRLASFRRGVRLRFLWGGLARLLTAALIAVVVVVALDWLAPADRTVRAVYALIALAGVALLAMKAFAPLRLRMDDEDLALAVEARHPALQDRLISALQLARAKAAFSSPVLAERAVAEALEACGSLDFAPAVRLPRQRRWTGYAAATALAFAALAAGSGTFRVGLARIVLDRPWPSAYALEVAPAASRVARGENLAVSARPLPGSRRPRRVVLHAEVAGEELELTMPLGQDGAYLGILEHLTQDATVWVSAGDFSSRRFPIKVLEKPVVSAFQVRLTPPDYTGLPATLLPPNAGHLRALRGTRVRLEGRASKPLQGCALAFSKTVLPLTLGEPGAFFGEFMVEASDSYVITLEDAEGLKASHPVSYQLTVIKDQDPFVRILKPGKDMGVLATARIVLEIEAQDDYGLGEGSLVTVANRGTAQEQEGRSVLFAPPAAKDTKALKVQQVWDLAPLKLEPGRQLRYRAEAKDRDSVSGPNLGRSQEYGLTVISKEDLETNLQRILEEVVSDLGHARDEARQARSGMEALAAAPSDPAREARAAALGLSLGRLGQTLQQAQSALEAVQDMIAMNGASDQRRDEMLQAARDTLRQLTAHRLPEVSEQLKAAGRGDEAAWPRAIQGQEGVIQEIERTGNALSGAASFGDLLKRLERLIDESDRIKDRTARSGGAAPGP